MSPTGNRLLVAALILGLLGSGMALGVALDRIWLRPTVTRGADTRSTGRERPRGPAREKLLLDRFKTGLDLDAAQTDKTAAQIHLMFSELDSIKKRAQSDLKKIRDDRRAEIMKVLRPEQQRRFGEMISAFEKRRAERRRAQSHGLQ